MTSSPLLRSENETKNDPMNVMMFTSETPDQSSPMASPYLKNGTLRATTSNLGVASSEPMSAL